MKHFDKLAHIVLTVGLFFGAVVVYVARFDSFKQFLAIVVLVVFYLLWGIFYHLARRDLKRKIILEYLLVSSIATLAASLVFLT